MKYSRAETSELRQEIFQRCGGVCENCQVRAAREMDHFWGRREPQHRYNVWALCTECHRAKTVNTPSAQWWVRRYLLHIARRMVEHPMLAPAWEAQLERCLARLEVLRAKGMA